MKVRVISGDGFFTAEVHLDQTVAPKRIRTFLLKPIRTGDGQVQGYDNTTEERFYEQVTKEGGIPVYREVTEQTRRQDSEGGRGSA